MWQQDFEVVHQMPHTVVNSTGRQEQDSLLVSEPFLRRLFVDVHGVVAAVKAEPLVVESSGDEGALRGDAGVAPVSTVSDWCVRVVLGDL